MDGSIEWWELHSHNFSRFKMIHSCDGQTDRRRIWLFCDKLPNGWGVRVKPVLYNFRGGFAKLLFNLICGWVSQNITSVINYLEHHIGLLCSSVNVISSMHAFCVTKNNATTAMNICAHVVYLSVCPCFVHWGNHMGCHTLSVSTQKRLSSC